MKHYVNMLKHTGNMKYYVKTYRYLSNVTILPFFKHDF